MRMRRRPRARMGDREWRVNIYMALRLMRKTPVAAHPFSPRASTSNWRSQPSCSTERRVAASRPGAAAEGGEAGSQGCGGRAAPDKGAHEGDANACQLERRTCFCTFLLLFCGVLLTKRRFAFPCRFGPHTLPCCAKGNLTLMRPRTLSLSDTHTQTHLT